MKERTKNNPSVEDRLRGAFHNIAEMLDATYEANRRSVACSFAKYKIGDVVRTIGGHDSPIADGAIVDCVINRSPAGYYIEYHLRNSDGALWTQREEEIAKHMPGKKL